MNKFIVRGWVRNIQSHSVVINGWSPSSCTTADATIWGYKMLLAFEGMKHRAIRCLEEKRKLSYFLNSQCAKESFMIHLWDAASELPGSGLKLLATAGMYGINFIVGISLISYVTSLMKFSLIWPPFWFFDTLFQYFDIFSAGPIKVKKYWKRVGI